MKQVILAGAAAVALSVAAVVAIATPTPNASTAALLGRTVDDFQLVDQSGVAHQFRYYKTAKALVIVTQVNGDAGSRAAMRAVEAMKAQNPGVEFMFLNSSLTDTRATIAAEARAQNVTLPILDDETQLVGEALGATYAGEAFVVEPRTWKVVYHGPVAGRNGLAAALTAFNAGQPIRTAEVRGRGTSLSFPGRAANHAGISYVRDVAPILEAKCVACHQPNSIAPWSMTSYEVVKGYAPMMREAIRTDRMPPYNADSAVGHFQQNENLTAAEQQTLVHWIEAGAPRGEGADPLSTAVHPRADWPLGTPDLVVDVPAYQVAASGVVDYQTPAVANPLTTGRWLRATTFKPGDRRGVHHILAGWIPNLPQSGHGGFDWDLSMGGYAVGNESNLAPEGWATWVPPGGAISFQMHYTPYGRAYNDTSKVAFYFQDQAPQRMMRQIVIADPTIEILPNTARHHERAYVRFPADALIYGAQPHAHYRGFSSKVTLIKPDGTQTVLLNLPKYDFGYQREYIFQDLIAVPAGSVVVADYLYDNSTNNPANPDANATIHWGDQSFEEMLFTAIRFRWADETPDHKMDAAQQGLEASQFFGAVDDSMDGKLQLDELKGPELKPFHDNFALADSDHDGGLSPQEFQAAVNYMRAQAQRQRTSGQAPAAPELAPSTTRQTPLSDNRSRP